MNPSEFVMTAIAVVIIVYGPIAAVFALKAIFGGKSNEAQRKRGKLIRLRHCGNCQHHFVPIIEEPCSKCIDSCDAVRWRRPAWEPIDSDVWEL